MGGSGSPAPSKTRAGDAVPTLADLPRSGIGKSDLPNSLPNSTFAGAGLPASVLASAFNGSGLLGSGFFDSDLADPFRKPNVDGVGMVAFGAAVAGAGGRSADLVDPSDGCGGKPAAMRGRAVALCSAPIPGRAGSPPEAPEFDAATVRGAPDDSFDVVDVEGADATRGRTESRPLASGGALPEFTASAPA